MKNLRHIKHFLIVILMITAMSCEDSFYNTMESENIYNTTENDNSSTQQNDSTQWTQTAVNIPGREGMVIAQSDDKSMVYIYGGREYGSIRNDLWVYNNTTGTATYLNNYVPRAFSAGKIINNRLYIFGGISGSQDSEQIHDEILVYDIAANTWASYTGSDTNGTTPAACYMHIAMKQNNLLIIHGGGVSYNNDYDSIKPAKTTTYILDTATTPKMTWSKAADGPQLFGHSATATDTGYYIFGGYGPPSTARTVTPLQFSAELWKYSVTNDSWALLSANNAPDAPRSGSALSYHNGKLYITSGMNKSLYKGMLLYDLSTGSWSNVEEFQPTSRAYHASWTYNNNLYIFGGITDIENITYKNDLWFLSF